MRRLWLKVPGYRVFNIRKDPEDSKKTWMDVRLGDSLVVRGVYVVETEASRERGEPFSQNWAMANLHFLDRQISHRFTTKKNPLLEDVLAAVFMECWGKLALVMQNGSAQTELDFVEPEAWGGKSLRIPVDFIRFKHLRCPHAAWPIYADVRLGHHIRIGEVVIYDHARFALDPGGMKGILDPGLRWAADLIFRRPRFRAFVRRLSESGTEDREREFIAKVPGCNPDGIAPSIRFY